MGKYAEALGYLEFEVKGMEYQIAPTKDDNLTLFKIYKNSQEGKASFMEAFHGFAVGLINRQEKFGVNSEDYKELETFVSVNINEFVEAIMTSFGWFDEADLKAMKAKSTEGFQKALNQ